MTDSPLDRYSKINRKIGLVVCAVGLLIAVPESFANDDVSKDLAIQVARVLEQLDSDELKVRVRAEQELLRLGTDVLPILPSPDLLDTATVRAAVQRIRRRLEHRKARESVMPGRVTLKKTGSLRSILADISRQTGNPLQLNKLPKAISARQLAVNWKEQPFWNVMDEIAARSRLQYRFARDSNELGFEVAETVSTNKSIVVGPFRVAARPTSLKPVFGDKSKRLLPIELELFCEPRLRPLFLTYAAADFQVSSSTTSEIKSFDPSARLELPLGEGGRQTTMKLNFELPAQASVSKVNLHGKMTMQTAAGIERIAFSNLLKASGTARRRGGVTVTLVKSRLERLPSKKWTARFQVAVSYDFGGPAFETHRTWIFQNDVFMEDRNKRRTHYSDFQTSLQSNGAVIVDYQFDELEQQPDRYRFVYMAPTLIIDVPIEFKLTDIPVSPPRSERKLKNER